MSFSFFIFIQSYKLYLNWLWKIMSDKWQLSALVQVWARLKGILQNSEQYLWSHIYSISARMLFFNSFKCGLCTGCTYNPKREDQGSQEISLADSYCPTRYFMYVYIILRKILYSLVCMLIVEGAIQYSIYNNDLWFLKWMYYSTKTAELCY